MILDNPDLFKTHFSLDVLMPQRQIPFNVGLKSKLNNIDHEVIKEIFNSICSNRKGSIKELAYEYNLRMRTDLSIQMI